MKRIGLLGGMSWESSIEYERIINEAVRERLGGVHSADLIIRSFDFAEIEALQSADDWDAASALLAGAARDLERAGAELLVLCTNTMHEVAGAITDAVSIPFLHIGDATGEAVCATGTRTIGLLGTRYTMEREFYRQHLVDRFDLDVRIPNESDRALIHQVIYDELVRGVVRDESRAAYVDVVARLVGEGCTGIIAGCTEIELLIGQEDIDVPLFPTTRLHALAAVDLALRE